MTTPKDFAALIMAKRPDPEGYTKAVQDYITGETASQPKLADFNLSENHPAVRQTKSKPLTSELIQKGKELQSEPEPPPEPKPEPIAKPAEKPANPFAALAAKSTAKPAQKPDATKATDANAKRLLHGTGFTKKIGEAAEKLMEKEQEQTPVVSGLVPKEKYLAEATHYYDVVEAATRAEKEVLAIKEKELGKDITLDKFQAAALNGLKRQKYACLIGAAGTGKTTVERQLAEALEDTTPIIDINTTKIESKRSSVREYGAAICFCAFTGRAVQQMKRALPRKYWRTCQTIHATLGYMPTEEEYFDKKAKEWKVKRIFRPTFTATNKLPYKICIVDEAGMVPIDLWNELIAALPEDARVILIGDINQLPPVQGRSVLGFAMIKWPTYTLEKIHRQAADNPIIANAHRILQGHFPKTDPKKFALVSLPNGSVKTFEKMFNLNFENNAGIIHTLTKKELFDPFRDAIITGQNKGTLGQVYINEKLVHYFNPQKEINGVIVNKREIITAGYMHFTYAVGDKVMLLQNDRDRQLTNGMTGVVVDLKRNGDFVESKSAHSQIALKSNETIDWDNFDQVVDEESEAAEAVADDEPEDESQRQASHIMMVRFGAGDMTQEVQFQTAGQFKKITHAYAFTCHKSQGGEYPTVVIVCHSSQRIMLTREWLYTAVTRAQERVILCCNDRGLAAAIRTQRIKGNSVREKAECFLELQDKTDTKIPFLPEPEEIENVSHLSDNSLPVN